MLKFYIGIDSLRFFKIEADYFMDFMQVAKEKFFFPEVEASKSKLLFYKESTLKLKIKF